MMMPGRNYSAQTDYRYGFNGKKNDNEVKGEGNEQDYGMRIYDPRVGRFLSVDPLTKKYPDLSPFQFA
jgi:RHS repeat-associated protein